MLQENTVNPSKIYKVEGKGDGKEEIGLVFPKGFYPKENSGCNSKEEEHEHMHGDECSEVVWVVLVHIVVGFKEVDQVSVELVNVLLGEGHISLISGFYLEFAILVN